MGAQGVVTKNSHTDKTKRGGVVRNNDESEGTSTNCSNGGGDPSLDPEEVLFFGSDGRKKKGAKGKKSDPLGTLRTGLQKSSPQTGREKVHL